MDVQKILTKIRQGSPLYTVSYYVYKNFYKNEKDANEAYRRLVPAIKTLITPNGRSSKQMMLC